MIISQSTILLYVGVGVSGISLIVALIAVIAFSVSNKRLKNALNEEYGEKRK